MADNVNYGAECYNRFKNNYDKPLEYYSTTGAKLGETAKTTPQQAVWGLSNFVGAKRKDYLDSFDKKNGGNGDGQLQVEEYVKAEKTTVLEQTKKLAATMKKDDKTLEYRTDDEVANDLIILQQAEVQALSATKNFNADKKETNAAVMDNWEANLSLAKNQILNDESNGKYGELVEEHTDELTNIVAFQSLLEDDKFLKKSIESPHTGAMKKIYGEELFKDLSGLNDLISAGGDATKVKTMKEEINKKFEETSGTKLMEQANVAADNISKLKAEVVDGMLTKKIEHAVKSLDTNDDGVIDEMEDLAYAALMDDQGNTNLMLGAVDTGINGLITEFGSGNAAKQLQMNSITKNKKDLNAYKSFLADESLKAREYTAAAEKGDPLPMPFGVTSRPPIPFNPAKKDVLYKFIMEDSQREKDGKIFIDKDNIANSVDSRVKFSSSEDRDALIKEYKAK